MSFNWQDYFQQDKQSKQAIHQFRELKILEQNQGRNLLYQGRELINFASNDYLGLCHHRAIIEAGNKAAETWGAGSGSSRLISGTTALTQKLEKGFAELTGKPGALLLNSGYNANIGILSSLADRETLIFTDRLNHASIYDGLSLCRGKMLRYGHNDIDALETLLNKNKEADKKIIISDSLFSMEGDKARLKELVELKTRYNALLIVDEAHSIGVFGSHGSGLVKQLNLEDQVDIVIGTLGKAFGVFGAFIAASEELREYLINHCRPFIFTTALPPFILGALEQALELLSRENRGEEILKQAEIFRHRLMEAGINTGASESQIIPVIVKENHLAISLMEHLLSKAYYAPAIRPPTVPVGTSRVRISLSWAHSPEDREGLFTSIKNWYNNHSL